jgi:PKD repeat protein
MYATYRNLLALKAQVTERAVYARAHYAVIGTPLEIPVADFSASPLVVERGNAVQFVDASFGIVTRWRWTIAGVEHAEQNPLVIFDLPAGKYDVTLVVGNDAGDSEPVTKTGYIEIICTPPTVDFTASPTTVEKGGSVQFADASSSPTDIVSWTWTIPGVGVFTAQNPLVPLNVNAGAYNVTLSVVNRNGNASVTKSGYITVTQTYPTPDFGSNVTTVEKGQAVQFYDKSSNATSVRWVVEGVGTFTDRDPLVTFNVNAGAYDVTIEATNANGMRSKAVADCITVTQTLPTPDFTSDITQVTQGGHVQFIDKSQNATSRRWTIEDIGDLTDLNPRVQFNNVGRKDIALAATNANGTRTKTVGDYIEVVSVPPQVVPSAYRTGVLCCYGSNAGGFDTMLMIENRKQTPLCLSICAYNENGTPLMSVYTVPTDIPAGRCWQASMAMSGIFPTGISGLVVLWDAQVPDDGVDGMFAGQWILYEMTDPIPFFAANAMTRVPDRRSGRAAVARRSGIYLQTVTGWDTGIALINANRSLQYVPGGSLSGTPQTMVTVAVTGTYFDQSGAAGIAVHGNPASFPVKAILMGIASSGLFLKDSDNSALTGVNGQLALSYTGDIIGVEWISDAGMAHYCALFDIQPQFEA